MFRSKKIFGHKIFLGQKIFGVKKIFRSKKCSGQKKFWVEIWVKIVVKLQSRCDLMLVCFTWMLLTFSYRYSPWGGGEIAKVIPSTSIPIGINLDWLGLRFAKMVFQSSLIGIHIQPDANEFLEFNPE